MTTRKTTTKKTATEKTATQAKAAIAAYEIRAADIGILIDLIRGELAKHAVQAHGAPEHWGYAGDLDRVRADLIQAFEFLSQKRFMHAG